MQDFKETDLAVLQRLVAASVFTVLSCPPRRTDTWQAHRSVLCRFLRKGGDPAAGSPTATLLRLHPNHRTDRWRLPPLRVGSTTSGPSNFRGVTGGVYKARERIHRGVLIRDY